MEIFKMKWSFLSLVLFTSAFALGQQISCEQFDDQHGYKPPEYTMKGCRSFNELQRAGGIKITKGKGIKSYACFATTFPDEGQDLFIFASLGGVMQFDDNKEQNGMASMQTFLGGVEANNSFTPVTWTQYPKETPFL